ncbi:hypothetical protein GCM10011376_35020 [Nocardioides flavus (ex Wang et al. 2016)]|uniref:Uncharacterized protein n=1 Tax=Nocardioides flavus (ex Wang et al. 2016) TaxID=2058780 RepID=A0ABQ3HQH4_9ACTN|nr:hypothetical protein [Nocardioides flavus (ex Wang et al. 2016)]GHE18892.1 hypothetical protein GCM10011376_35020 [Nocardioides flavus (ex Wang et al. 2016)]
MTPVTRPVRLVLLLAAVLVFLAGLQLTVFPTRTSDWFAWTIDVPMTAVFLGAAYWSAVVLELAGARAAGWGRARLTVWAVLVFTVLTLVVTLVHLDGFHLGAEHPVSARVVTWGWLAIYAGVPVLMVLGLLAQSRAPAPVAAGTRVVRRLPAALRGLLAGLAAVLLMSGLALLVVPTSAAAGWSWPLTPLTARAVGAWLVGLGWAAGHACTIDDAGDVRPLGATGCAFVVLQAVALGRYGDALDRSSWQAVAYAVVLAWIAVVSAWILALRAADAAERGRSR